MSDQGLADLVVSTLERKSVFGLRDCILSKHTRPMTDDLE
jgi:hypothetical protein